MEFVTGQRYINNADLQLGLGRVMGDNHRMVKVAFDAVGEERIYAKDSAPLSRFEARIDDRLQHKDGWYITIREVKNLNGLNIYFGVRETGEEEVIPESEISDNISLDRPADRLLNAQFDKARWYDLRQQTWYHQQRLMASPLYGLTGCRTALLPHQLYIAHSVGQRHAPRVLLADEVGLGKTIEAGLIVHQQLLTNRAQRVLMVVPESLTHQWMVELLRRFNLSVSVLDEEKCQETESSSGFANPFEASQLVLLPLELLVNNPVRAAQVIEAKWDLLVVDEAHHLQWFDEASGESDNPAVQAYQLIESLSQVVPGVLLLTATPEQLGRKSHFARLRLLDADRFADYESFIKEEQTFEAIADVIEQLLTAAQHQELTNLSEIRKQLTGVLSADQCAQLPEQITENKQVYGLINQLLDQHGTGRVLFRNTRHSVTGFPTRELHPYPLPAPDIYLNNEDSRQSLIPETTVADDVDWMAIDPRVNWLVSQAKANKREKLLVIASQAGTVLQLERCLREQHGIHAAVFHEGMSLIERDQSAAWFADEEHGAQLLLCSEIGSEGRNFQFAHHLLFFDLPEHPDLLEQRIGRLDRIGQQQTIQIHVCYLSGTAQERWFTWYDQGLQLFARTNPAAHHVFTAMSERLHQPLDDQQLTRLITDSQEQSEQLLQQMNRGRDRLLEYNSCRPEQAAELTAAAFELEQSAALEQYMHQVFDLFGVHHEEHKTGSEVIRPTDEMHGYFPFLLEEGMTITYDREVALANETYHFITWEHPMVTETMDMLLNQEMGNSGFMVLKGSGLNAGQLFLECRYLVQSSGHANMQLSRYLPPQMKRLLLAEAGVNVAEKLTEKLVSQFTGGVPMNVAVEVVKAKLPVIKKLLKKADDMMQADLPDLKAVAAQRLNDKLEQEISRLKQLAAHNGQVRSDEIEFQEKRLLDAQKSISQIQPQLDSVRILVTM
ncbi:RNA polymerase-associated protein RapA [Marinicella sediminis]|uniref:RNA polymerase-associated protein RapA n=1 Tax=Marinicella sediminis TaxID=1792834 RepID=A0ABV7JB21_9GAMM|nr:RNA polymerase-associated protein RapA [Marinicella sediminis]